MNAPSVAGRLVNLDSADWLSLVRALQRCAVAAVRGSGTLRAKALRLGRGKRPKRDHRLLE